MDTPLNPARFFFFCTSKISAFAKRIQKTSTTDRSINWTKTADPPNSFPMPCSTLFSRPFHWILQKHHQFDKPHENLNIWPREIENQKKDKSRKSPKNREASLKVPKLCHPVDQLQGSLAPVGSECSRECPRECPRKRGYPRECPTSVLWALLSGVSKKCSENVRFLVPSFRFVYHPSFRFWGSVVPFLCALVPVFGTEEHPPRPPFREPPISEGPPKLLIPRFCRADLR